MKPILLGILTATVLAGCSGPSVRSPARDTSEPVAGEVAVPVEKREDRLAGKGPQDQEASTPDKLLKSGFSYMKPDLSKAQTSMNIEPEVRREYQNGPTREEIVKYRKLVSRKSKPMKRTRSGQSAPVYDSEMLKVR